MRQEEKLASEKEGGSLEESEVVHVGLIKH